MFNSSPACPFQVIHVIDSFGHTWIIATEFTDSEGVGGSHWLLAFLIQHYGKGGLSLSHPTQALWDFRHKYSIAHNACLHINSLSFDDVVIHLTVYEM